MVKKERKPAYLLAQALIKKGLYSQQEYDAYKSNRQKIEAMNLKERGKELTSEQRYRASKERYESRTPQYVERKYKFNRQGKFIERNKKLVRAEALARLGFQGISGAIARTLPAAYSAASTRGGITQALYRRQGQLPPTNVQNRFKTIQGMKSGKRGRPVGTLDKRYQNFGGVYGYRKYMAHQRFLERQRILQERAVTPQQQMILAQIRARENYNAQNMESKIIPDTRGEIFLSDIFQQINDASNLVG